MVEAAEKILAVLEDTALLIKKAQINLKKCPKQRLTKGYVETRLKSMEQYWQTFKDTHNELVKCVPKEKRMDLPYFVNEDYFIIEDLYTCIQADLVDLLSTIITPRSMDSRNTSNSSFGLESSQVKLPQIQLPIFTGVYEDWPTFQDMYVSLVHNNNSLSKVQKLQYLKSSTKGEAESLLKHIQVIEANYEQAWEVLKSRAGITLTFCNRNLQTVIVCCSDESSILNTAPDNNSGRRPVWSNNNQQTNGDYQRLSEKKCKEYSSRVYESVGFLLLLPDPERISISAPKCDYNGVKLIVGGTDAQTGEFPHMAAIGWVNLEGTHSFLCGGSLISTKFVLTAAHCTKNSRMKQTIPVIVRLGDQNLDPTKNDGASPIEVPIKSIRKHPQYKSPGKYHDIALLELASDIDFDAAIRPACLWNKPDFPGHTKAVATGWGVVDPRTLRSSDELQKVSLSLLKNDRCNCLLQIYINRLWPEGITENQLCAGELGGGKDTCQGDSGSPLQVVSHENKCVFHLIGVTSFGIKCAQSGSPAVYTRVSSYLDWIESVVWPGES